MQYKDDTLKKKSSIAMEVKKIRIKSSNLANHIDIKINQNYKVYRISILKNEKLFYWKNNKLKENLHEYVCLFAGGSE